MRKKLTLLAMIIIVLSSCSQYGWVVRTPDGERYFTKKMDKTDGITRFKTSRGRVIVHGDCEVHKVRF